LPATSGRSSRLPITTRRLRSNVAAKKLRAHHTYSHGLRISYTFLRNEAQYMIVYQMKKWRVRVAYTSSSLYVGIRCRDSVQTWFRETCPLDRVESNVCIAVLRD